jgi:hypothetical protein
VEEAPEFDEVVLDGCTSKNYIGPLACARSKIEGKGRTQTIHSTNTL